MLLVWGESPGKDTQLWVVAWPASSDFPPSFFPSFALLKFCDSLWRGYAWYLQVLWFCVWLGIEHWDKYSSYSSMTKILDHVQVESFCRFVMNLLPLGSKFTLTYLLWENVESLLKRFPSSAGITPSFANGGRWGDVAEGSFSGSISCTSRDFFSTVASLALASCRAHGQEQPAVSSSPRIPWNNFAMQHLQWDITLWSAFPGTIKGTATPLPSGESWQCPPPQNGSQPCGWAGWSGAHPWALCTNLRDSDCPFYQLCLLYSLEFYFSIGSQSCYSSPISLLTSLYVQLFSSGFFILIASWMIHISR